MSKYSSPQKNIGIVELLFQILKPVLILIVASQHAKAEMNDSPVLPSAIDVPDSKECVPYKRSDVASYVQTDADYNAGLTHQWDQKWADSEEPLVKALGQCTQYTRKLLKNSECTPEMNAYIHLCEQVLVASMFTATMQRDFETVQIRGEETLRNKELPTCYKRHEEIDFERNYFLGYAFDSTYDYNKAEEYYNRGIDQISKVLDKRDPDYKQSNVKLIEKNSAHRVMDLCIATHGFLGRRANQANREKVEKQCKNFVKKLNISDDKVPAQFKIQ